MISSGHFSMAKIDRLDGVPVIRIFEERFEIPGPTRTLALDCLGELKEVEIASALLGKDQYPPHLWVAGAVAAFQSLCGPDAPQTDHSARTLLRNRSAQVSMESALDSVSRNCTTRCAACEAGNQP